MIDPLCIVTAGAGSGKTHTIQDRLRTWVANDTVKPERILAVTYTEAAAAELRDRISAGLLEAGRVEEALRLSQAYISTIHSLGLRILTEFAFEAGSSPQPRLLSEDEESALITRALERTDKADHIAAHLDAYGYAFDVGSGATAEQIFRRDLLRVVNMLRSTGTASLERTRELVKWAEWQLTEEYGEAVPESGQTGKLRLRIRQLLDEYPNSLDEQFGTSQTAVNQFRANFQCLVRGARTGSLESDWYLWEQLRKLRTLGDSLPGGYVRRAEAVMEAADALTDHEGPLKHAQGHIRDILFAAQAVLESYNQAKREAGLVDYTDMIATAGQLLRERPEVLEALASQIDCLVVDEFQDTNPLQFDLLWQLKRANVPTLVVGDLKQAIMGFQGADPRLFAALERKHRSVSRPLTRNWRSQPSLMDFVNSIGEQLFGDQYVKLSPQRSPSGMEALETVRFIKHTRKDWHAVRAFSVGTRLKRLLEDPTQEVHDRRTGTRRKLRGSDIAVLCPTNAVADSYANVLRAMGLEVNHESAGWLTSAPVRLALNALAYVANPGDRHAALLLCSTELGSLTLEEGARHLIKGDRIDDPLLRKLEGLSEGVADRTVYAVVAETLSVLELFDAVSCWPDGQQARANLVRLLGEAAEFMDANREALAHSGYHGQGIETFLGWLASGQEEDKQPDKSVLQENAVTLRTWHSAKGLEWPIVAVCNMDRALVPRLPSLDLEFGSFDDLGNILKSARIAYWPHYAAQERQESVRERLREGQLTEARRLLYVALTRARDKLLIEWPEFQSQRQKIPTYSYWKLLKGVWELDAKNRWLQIKDRIFPCEVIEGDQHLPSDFDSGSSCPLAFPPVAGRRAIRRATPPAEWTPDSVAASALAGRDEADPPSDLRCWSYGPGLEIELDLSSKEAGTYLHRCFEVLGSHPDLAGQMERLTGVSVSPEAEARIAEAVGRFETWLQGQFRIESVMREWPVLMLNENGTVVSGEADLVIETADGTWVIDHKSDRNTDPGAAFRQYEAQLSAYARALSDEGRTVAGIGLNLIRAGQVIWRRPSLPGREGQPAPATTQARTGPSGIPVP